MRRKYNAHERKRRLVLVRPQSAPAISDTFSRAARFARTTALCSAALFMGLYGLYKTGLMDDDTLVDLEAANNYNHKEKPALKDTVNTPSLTTTTSSLKESLSFYAQQIAQMSFFSWQTDSPLIASIKRALRAATANTPIPYEMMERMAMAESSLRPDAVNDKSGACGLFQIAPESTLLELLDKFAAKHGYEDYSAGVVVKKTMRKDGKMDFSYSLSQNKNKADKTLSACFDYKLSSHLAVENLQKNLVHMEDILGRSMTYTDAYFSHFLGLQGSLKFLGAYYNHPETRHHDATQYVARIVAKQNPRVFYKDAKMTQPRSIGEVYDFFAAKMTVKKIPSVRNTILAQNHSKQPERALTQ